MSAIPAWAVLVLPPFCAAILGIVRWLGVRSQPLAPDAQTYLDYAAAFGPSSLFGGFREPVWIGLMALPVGVFGASPDVVMLQGVVGFALMVAAFHLVARLIHPWPWALAASLLLSVSPWLVFQSARGLREETSAAIMLFFAFLVMRLGRSARNVAVLGLVSGLGAMLRWDTLLISIPLIVLAFGLRRFPLRYWTVSLVVVCVVVAPLVVGNWVRTGDPVHHSNMHARFFRNQEFRGQPGFPTSDEVARNGFAGSSITWAGYLFGLHTPQEVARRTLFGLVRAPYITTYNSLFFFAGPLNEEDLTSFSARYLKLATAVLLVMAGVAGGLILLFGRGWPLAVMLFLSMAEFSPIAERMDPRLALTIVPCMLLGILDLGALLVGRRQQERARIAAALSVALRPIGRRRKPLLDRSTDS